MLKYWHTLRHLRASQLIGRARYRLARPHPDLRPAPGVRPLERGRWVAPARRRPSVIGPGRFDLLNESRDLALCGWDDPAVAKLWRYHQHYFDDLNAIDADDRGVWHRALVAGWIAQVPPASGTGWEPYPTSLRIVNWIKWHLRCGGLADEALQSLAIQARWLAQRIEWHLLGNHLFSNAKALLFAGTVFEGPEAEQWRATGQAILHRELPEQVLADGGHFERSPMYHALAFEDVLDILNLANAYPGAVAPALVASLRATAPRMRHALRVCCHPDGEIAFFNDAAMGVAPAPAELETYADRLAVDAPGPLRRVERLADTGYIRVSDDGAAVLIDVAPIGPDYLPAHAHADTLSCEWSVRGRRVLVNSGTSVYGTGGQRQQERGTAAHNTVVVGGCDSSEVWAGFRVGRRARPGAVSVQDAGIVTVSASHDGYQRIVGGAVRRTWRMGAGLLEVEDRVPSSSVAATARFHLHPDVALEDASLTPGRCTLRRADGLAIRVTVGVGALGCESSEWHPEFGRSVPNVCLVVGLDAGHAHTRFEWD